MWRRLEQAFYGFLGAAGIAPEVSRHGKFVQQVRRWLHQARSAFEQVYGALVQVVVVAK